MSILANIIATFGCLIILVSNIIFAKTKDLFSSIHLIIISNIYGISLLIIGVSLGKLNFISWIKIIVLILLNIIITIVVTYCLARKASLNKVNPSGEIIKLDYKTLEEND